MVEGESGGDASRDTSGDTSGDAGEDTEGDSEVDYEEGRTKEEVEGYDSQQESEETESVHSEAEESPTIEDELKEIEEEPIQDELPMSENDIENPDDLLSDDDLPMRGEDLKDSEENLDLQELPQTFDEVEKAIKESEERLDLTEVPQTFDEVEKALKESKERLDLSEIPQTFDEVEKALKESEERLDLTEVPQTFDEVEKALKESEERLNLSEVPKSIDELNALEDYQNKNIVKNSIRNIMRMSPEQRESHGLPREYTNHELDIFFAQIDTTATLDSNNAKPSEVSNPEGSGPFSRNGSFDGKSEGLKKESVNKIIDKEMTSDSDIKQKETSSTLNKDIEKSSIDNYKSKLANIDWKRQYLQTKKGMEETSNEKSEFDINNLEKIENTLDSKKIELATINDKIKKDNKDLKEWEKLKKEKKEEGKSKKKIEELNKENLKNKSESEIEQLNIISGKNRNDTSEDLLKNDLSIFATKRSWKDWTYEMLLEEFTKICYKLGVKDGFAPTKTQIENIEYRYIMSGITSLRKMYKKKGIDKKINYSTLVKDAGFNIKHDIYKYSNIRTLKEAAEKLMSIKDKLGILRERPPTRAELEDGGYSGFLNMFRNKKFTYNDAVRAAGLIPNYDSQKWMWLDKGDTLYLASNYFKKIYEQKLKNLLDLENNKAPRSGDLIEYGPKGFYYAVVDRGFTYNELVRAASLYPNVEPFKWGNTFNIVDAKDYLMKLINSGALDHLELSEGESPTIQQLKNSNNDFVQKFSKQGIKYNDILRLTGLQPNHEPYKYYNYKISDFIGLFKEIMDTNEIKDLNLGVREAPTLRQLYELGFGFFPSAIQKKEINYNEILRKSGYDINHEIRKYEGYSNNDFKQEVKKIILGSFLRDELNLTTKEAPTIKQLINLGYGDIIHQLIDRKISYNDVVKDADLVPNMFQTSQEIGKILHPILEYFFMIHTISKNINSYFEIRPSILDNRKQCDITILYPETYYIAPSKNIKMINIDYTMSSDSELLLDKCFRGYQGKHKKLIIVPLYMPKNYIKMTKSKLHSFSIPFMEKVDILTSQEFLNLFSFPDNIRDKFFYYLRLAKDSFDDEALYNQLERDSLKAKNILKTKFKARQQNGFEKFLRERGDYSLLKQG